MLILGYSWIPFYPLRLTAWVDYRTTNRNKLVEDNNLTLKETLVFLTVLIKLIKIPIREINAKNQHILMI